ncbi:hypothetical protein [Nocardia sp. SC052]|uniref:hypothetical protein n=1 Tax=Nocardia sichangensis TaxID=3385975 RepID=UPI00399FC818
MEPTTEMVLSHKHPDDRDTVAATLASSVQHDEPFCSRHRIIDTTARCVRSWWSVTGCSMAPAPRSARSATSSI